MAKALVPIADGSEEMEAVIIVDVLRRAGWEVALVGLGRKAVTASRGVRLVADAEWHEIDPADFDLLILPGGMDGMNAMRGDEGVLEAVRCFHQSDRIVAAICAAPLVLQAAGILNGKRATCHPAVREQLTCTRRLDDRVVKDGAIITSQAPGTAMEFALALIDAVDGWQAAERVAAGLVLAGEGC